MNPLRDYVDWKLAHSDKISESEGYPLVMENCKSNKKMKELKVQGHNLIKDNRTASRETATITIKGSLITMNGSNSSNIGFVYDSNHATLLKANVKYTLSLHYISGELVKADTGVNFGICKPDSTWAVSLTARYVSNYTNVAYKTFTMAEDTYVSFGYVGNGEFNNLVFGIQLVEGDSVGDYMGYVGEYIADETDFNFGKYKIPIVQSGKNLYDVKTYPSTDGQCVWGNTGTVGMFNGMSVTGYIPCSELRGKTITCGLGGFAAPGICFYDDNKTYISGKVYANKSTITTTVPENASYLRWCFNTDTKDQAMIVEGETLTNYEPYIEPKTHTVYVDEPLSANDVLDVKEHMELPKLTAKTTVFTTDTTTPPSKMYAKYIKR